MSYWTSIEDGEPEKQAIVLVTTGVGKVALAEYRGNDCWVSEPGKWNLYVVAWMDRPKPYLPAQRLKPQVNGPGV